MRRFVPFLLLVLGAIAPRLAAAQPVPPSQSPVRYHYGDNPGWADPGFDDKSWSVAPNGRVPIPPVRSDGFVWVRVRVAVPIDGGERMAVRVVHPDSSGGSEQVYLDGVLIGHSDAVLPLVHGNPQPTSAVLDAAGAAVRKPFATVAVRLWYSPYTRYYGGEDAIGVQIGPAVLLNAQQRADRLALILSWLPFFSLNGIAALVGAGLLGLGLWSRRRELLWFSLLLLFYPFAELFWVLPSLISRDIASHLQLGFFVLGAVTTMFVTVEFLWIIFGLRSRLLRILLHGAWVVFNASELVAVLATSASSNFVVAIRISAFALGIFNLGALLVELRFLVTGPNRAIAAAMAVIPVASTLMRLHFDPTDLFGIPHLELFDTGCLVAGGFLSVMLVRRALTAWRQGNHLRMELAAAREVQQVLVPAENPSIPGFAIEAVYKPAGEVGGDFYQIVATPDGGVLIVIGDVSGKGMPAAMTVSLLVGTFRTLAHYTQSPSEILHAMNIRMLARTKGGFTTCMVLRVDPGGTLSAANAGHLAPYLDGSELPLENGLPLGINAASSYPESKLSLPRNARLTLITDGVVEARNASGELFGFDRTAAITTQPAEAIAQTAQAFGQEDDITVLTLQFAPAGVTHA